jgi:hypothetical protein
VSDLAVVALVVGSFLVSQGLVWLCRRLEVT